MRLAGFSFGYVVKTGLAALVFLLLFNFIARRVGGPLQSIAAAA